MTTKPTVIILDPDQEARAAEPPLGADPVPGGSPVRVVQLLVAVAFDPPARSPSQPS